MHQHTAFRHRTRRSQAPPLVGVLLVALVLFGGVLGTPATSAATSQDDQPREVGDPVRDFHEDFTPPILGDLDRAEIKAIDSGEKALLLSTENRTSSSFTTEVVVGEDAQDARLLIPVSGTIYAADTAVVRMESSNGTSQEKVLTDLDSPEFQTIEMNADAFRDEDPTLLTIRLEGPSGSSRLFVDSISLVHDPPTQASIPVTGASQGSGTLLPLLAGGLLVILAVNVWLGRRVSKAGPATEVEEATQEIRSIKRQLSSDVEEGLASNRELLEDARELHEDFRESIHDALLVLDRINERTDGDAEPDGEEPPEQWGEV